MTNPILGQIVTIAVGVALIIAGRVLIQRKRMNIPIGGRGGIRPLFSIPLRGIGAVIFGIAAILCGVLIIGFAIAAFIQPDSGIWTSYSISILQFLVVAGLLVGFGIGMVMQILMLFVDAAAKNNKRN